MAEVTDLNSYTFNSDFYGELNLILTIKSFDLQAIRKRYLESRKNISGKAGSVNRRPVAEGGLAHMKISEGKCKEESILNRMAEPRGIDFRNGNFAFAAEDVVFVLRNASVQRILNPWFSYIHTVQLSPFHENRILIVSSGMDCIFEYDLDSGKIVFEWFAWENGFNQGHDPETNAAFVLTRNPVYARELEADGRKFILIDNPKAQVLPTAKRAAFINSVCYDPEDQSRILATFFHEGAVYAVDRDSGEAKVVLDGLKNPHGGRRTSQGYMGTSTASGEVVLKEGSSTVKFDFSHLPGKAEGLEGAEWIQNTIRHGDSFISIDSNRNSLVIFDPSERLIDMISFDDNWAVQDLVAGKLSEEQTGQIRNI